MPASTRPRIRSGVDTAGPSVHTILARRVTAIRLNPFENWAIDRPPAAIPTQDERLGAGTVTPSGRADGDTGAGSRSAAPRWAWIAAAAARPSAIAQTINDAPRCMSPAT